MRALKAIYDASRAPECKRLRCQNVNHSASFGYSVSLAAEFQPKAPPELASQPFNR